MADRTASPASPASPTNRLIWTAIGITVGLLWAFWPSLRQMAHKWLNDPQYSHGYLVPLFSLYLLWSRRDILEGSRLRPSWWGLLPLALAAGLRHLATLNYDWFDGVALVLSLFGLVLLAAGGRALMWAWPAVAFLLFMVPLPYRIEVAVAHPLQSVATACTTYVMQTLGMAVIARGNQIVMPNGPPLNVVEACSGLSMLLIFFALSTAMAVVVKRPLLDKLIVLASAVPIAIIANVARITLTGLAQEAFGPELAHKFFHDWAGWFMMPLALGLLWLELGMLSLLLRAPSSAQDEVLFAFDHPFAPTAARSAKSPRTAKPATPPGGQNVTEPQPPLPPPPTGPAAPFAAAGS